MTIASDQEPPIGAANETSASAGGRTQNGAFWSPISCDERCPRPAMRRVLQTLPRTAGTSTNTHRSLRFGVYSA